MHSPDYAINYVYDQDTQRHTETWTGTSYANAVTDILYGCNSMGELASVTVLKENGQTPATVQSSTIYDAAGGTSTTNLPNTVYTYDAGGRLTSSIDSAVGITTSYTYKPNTNTAGITTITYYLVDTQNPTGYAQPIEQAATPGSPQITYVWGKTLISQTYATGATIPGVGTATSPTTYYILTDAHGSTRLVVNATGSVAEEMNYDAFGSALGFNASTAPTTYLYSSMPFDAASGNYYDHARFYNSGIGEFTQSDYGYSGSLADPMSYLPYAFTGGDPINMVDLSGHDGVISVVVEFTIELSLDVKNFAGSIYAGVRAADTAEFAAIGFNAAVAGTENTVFGPTNLRDWELFSIGFGAGLLQGLIATRAPTLAVALGTAVESTANQYFSDPTHPFSWASLAKLAVAEAENIGGVLAIRGLLSDVDVTALAKVLISTDVSLVRGDVMGLITCFQSR